DAATLLEKRRAEVGNDADNIRLDADGKTLAVGYGGSGGGGGAVAFLDAATLKKTGEVKLTGHPEAFQLEPGTARLFVNVPGGAIMGGGEIAVADRSAQTVMATWKLKEAGRN